MSPGGSDSALNPGYLLKQVFCFFQRSANLAAILPNPSFITEPAKTVEMIFMFTQGILGRIISDVDDRAEI